MYMARINDITNKITVLAEAKDEWYALHSKIMSKDVLEPLDTARARRCRVEISMLDKRISNLKEEYRKNRHKYRA